MKTRQQQYAFVGLTEAGKNTELWQCTSVCLDQTRWRSIKYIASLRIQTCWHSLWHCMKFDDLPGLFPCMLSMHIDHLEVGAMTSVELRIWRVGDPVYFYQPDIFGLQVLPLNLPEECIRVIHSSHFSLIFHLFSTSFLNHFLKMKLKMNRKRIIFEKSNHALVCTKIVIFTFIFTLHFSNSFTAVCKKVGGPWSGWLQWKQTKQNKPYCRV